tara:strand:- start:542 stop:760 length:219 start_codon:yes stop_codon:yes gene_type:complete
MDFLEKRKQFLRAGEGEQLRKFEYLILFFKWSSIIQFSKKWIIANYLKKSVFGSAAIIESARTSKPLKLTDT